MAKLTLTDVSSGYLSGTTYTANNTAIETAMENTLSRDGTAPNQMGANLDMNSYRVTNLPNAVANQEPVTLAQAASLASISTAFTQENVGAVLWPRTAAETSAGVTPTNYYYEPLNVLRYGATGDGVTDDTTAIQNAINVANVNGGVVYAPSGTYLGNWTIKSEVVVKGDGVSATIFKPVTDDAVFKTALNVSTNKIGFRDFRIQGDTADSSNDGIVLKTTTASTFVDNIEIKNVFIEQCGRYGIHTYGTGSTGPFVQRLKIRDCYVWDNVNHGLFMEGHSYECSAVNSFFVTNGGTAGSTANVYLDTNFRMLFRSCGFNHADAIAAANPDTAVEVVTGNQIKFEVCDFEEADPMLEIRASCKNISVDTCNFGSSSNATSFILLTSVDGCRIENNSFACTATITNYIRNTTAVTNVTRLSITDDNRFSTSGTLTKAVELVQDTSIASGEINASRSFLLVDTELDAVTDDLDTINGQDGGVLTLIDGQTITIAPFNTAHDVVVTNAGNILTNTGASITLDQTYKTFTARWSEARAKWIQV